MLRPDLSLVSDFLLRCFAPGETIALLLRGGTPASTRQRIVQLEQAIAPRCLDWLAHENASGANVYFAANPLRSGSRRRTKDSFAEVRHLYVDLDREGETRLAALCASTAVPQPTAIISSSLGKYQVLWRVAGFSFEQQEETLKALASSFGGDPACTDRNRVLRLPGFLNRKYEPPYFVSVEYGCANASAPGAFAINFKSTFGGPAAGTSSVRKPPKKHSQSESDWAWVLSELHAGTMPRGSPER